MYIYIYVCECIYRHRYIVLVHSIAQHKCISARFMQLSPCTEGFGSGCCCRSYRHRGSVVARDRGNNSLRASCWYACCEEDSIRSLLTTLGLYQCQLANQSCSPSLNAFCSRQVTGAFSEPKKPPKILSPRRSNLCFGPFATWTAA